MDGLRFRRLERGDDPLFWPALELYVETFPRDEREPLAWVAAVAAGQGDGRTDFLVAETDAGLAGIAYLSRWPEIGVGFLVYLAVTPSARGRGRGERLLEMVRDHCRDLVPGFAALALECERPEAAITPEERAVRERRIAFFERRGAVVVDREYVQPALAPDRSPVPLWLLAIPEPGADLGRLPADVRRVVWSDGQ